MKINKKSQCWLSCSLQSIKGDIHAVTNLAYNLRIIFHESVV